MLYSRALKTLAQNVICNDAQYRLLSKLAGLSISPSYILTTKVGYPWIMPEVQSFSNGQTAKFGLALLHPWLKKTAKDKCVTSTKVDHFGSLAFDRSQPSFDNHDRSLGLFLERLFMGKCFPDCLVRKESASQHHCSIAWQKNWFCVAVGTEWQTWLTNYTWRPGKFRWSNDDVLDGEIECI